MVKELLPLLAVTVSLVIYTEALWPWAMPYVSPAINHDRKNHHGRQWLPSLPRPSPPIYNDRHSHHGRQWPASLPRPSPPIYTDRQDPYEQERSYNDSLSPDDRKGHEDTPNIFSIGPASNMNYDKYPSAWEHYTYSGPGYDTIDSRKGHGGSGSSAWKHFTMNDRGLPSLPRPSPPIYNDLHDSYEQERSYDDSLSHDDRKGHENQGSSAWEDFTMMNSGRGYDNNDSRKGHGGSGSSAWKHFTMNDIGRGYEGGFNHVDRKGNADESLPPWKHYTSNT